MQETFSGKQNRTNGAALSGCGRAERACRRAFAGSQKNPFAARTVCPVDGAGRAARGTACRTSSGKSVWQFAPSMRRRAQAVGCPARCRQTARLRMVRRQARGLRAVGRLHAEWASRRVCRPWKIVKWKGSDGLCAGNGGSQSPLHSLYGEAYRLRHMPRRRFLRLSRRAHRLPPPGSRQRNGLRMPQRHPLPYPPQPGALRSLPRRARPAPCAL